MVQPDHPPPDLALVPRPLLAQQQLPVLMQRQPNARLGFWGFLEYGDRSVILGDVRTTDELAALHAQAQEDRARAARGFVDPLPSNADEYLMRLLVKNPADRRMQYRADLENAVYAAELGSQERRLLEGERSYWEAQDQIEMQIKLSPGLPFPLSVLLSRGRYECWHWTKPLEPGRIVPTTPSWRGMKYPAVHRLLWPVVKPADPFTEGHRPVRWTGECSDDWCVNPNHFIDPARHRELVRGVGRGHTGFIKSVNNIPWKGYANIVVLEDGTLQLRCPRCQTPAGYGKQREINETSEPWRELKGTMYCGNCYQMRKQAEGMFKRGREIRIPDIKTGETEVERQERMLREAAENDGFPPFKYAERAGIPEFEPDPDPDDEQETPPPDPKGNFIEGWSEEFKKKMGYDPDNPA